ncbi:PIR protein, partial [Plasmodium ovale]
GSSFDLSHAKTESPEGTLNPVLASPGLPIGDGMSKDQTLRGGEQTDKSGQVHSETLTLSNMNESYSIQSTSSTFCPSESKKEPCRDSYQASAVIEKESTNHLIQSSQEHTVNHSETDMDSQEKTGSTSITIISSSIILGIFFFLFILYKFTPLGSMVNNRKRKKNKWKINYEQYDQHLLYNPEFGNINSKNNKYNIAYYSLINSE